jgi:nucleoside-diphosphate-sugar epimerase
MKEILVTGANGFIGSHICEALLDKNYSVRALVRKTSDISNIENLKLKRIYGDLTDPASLKEAVSGVDGVISNAGLTKAVDGDKFHAVNAAGTENLLRACAEGKPGLQRFVQISTAAASGPADSMSPLTEDANPEPLTRYGVSKLQSEKAVMKYGDRFPAIVLRPLAVYGPRDKEMLSFFKIIKFGIKPTFGPGECYTNFTYVKDLAATVVKALEKHVPSGSIYFVAERRSYSFSEAGDIISEVMGRSALDVHIPVTLLRIAGKVNETVARFRKRPSIFTAEKALEISRKYWLVDVSKLEREMGFTCPTSFRDGVRQTVEWYRRHKWL